MGLGIWLACNVAVLAVGADGIAFDMPDMAGWSVGQRLLAANAVVLELVLLSTLVWRLARGRQASLAAPRHRLDRRRAGRELAGLVSYAVLAQAVGYWVAGIAGGPPISFHLMGTLHGTHSPVTPGQAVVWAAFNVIAYAVVPLCWFARRYTTRQMWLRSSNPSNDRTVILVVLGIETVLQLSLFGGALMALSGSQLAVGGVLTFGLYFLGTVLPTMILVQALMVPRLLAVTRSVAASVMLGGLAYAALHFFDGWTDYSNATTATLSLSLLMLQYFAPGMFKALLTLRTGNAWVHAWAYHSVSPHLWADTPLIVKVFGIR